MFVLLLCSTQLFIPSILFAYATHQRTLTFSFLISYIGSSLYYINYDGSEVFHALDLYTARTSAIINFLYAWWYVKPFYMSVILLNNVIMTYMHSCILYYYSDPTWVYAHIYFHIWTEITRLVITYEGR